MYFKTSECICLSPATLYTYLRNADELRFLFQVYVMYVEASSSCSSEHFWHDYPIHVGYNIILQSYQNGSYIQSTTYVSFLRTV
jgi:hypothetical protein